MRRRTVAVLTAGLGQPSASRLLADRLLAATDDEARRRGLRLDPHVVEVREHAHDVVNHLVTGFASAALKPVLDRVAGADGLIAVTPVFNASYSGLFKSFLDVLPEGALAGRPVLIGATGGTARHSLVLDHALRPLFSYLRATVAPTAVFAATADWAAAEAEGSLGGRIGRAGREFAEQLERHEAAPVVDPFALTTSFDRLLAGD